jgi:hypothetical protein
MTAGVGGQRTGPFIVTKEHRRFTEFAHAICTHRTIGVCFGPAGVGKTLSARRHAHWELAEPLLHTWGPRESSDAQVGFDHGVGHPLLLLYDAKTPRGQKVKEFNGLGDDPFNASIGLF